MEHYQQTHNTSREQDEGCVTWTVAEILERYNVGTFGIPHFQRGLVWDDAMLGDLIESLYYDTPCGAIVLWKPDQGNHGLTIGPRVTDKKAKHLIIDGQQRVRSLGRISGLLRAFRNHEGDGAPMRSYEDRQRDESTGEPQVWCVNLARTEEFKEVKQGREWPLFSRRADRGHQHYERSHLPHDFIPMRKLANFKNLESWESWNCRETYLSEDLRSKERSHLVKTKLGAVRDTLSKILERKLFVRILQREDFSDVVRVYIRINSAGKRVESEERALATLSALDSETNQRLREMFAAIHGPDADSHDAIQERDARLGRHPERTLGFKFLMRAFVQACAQHSNLSADAASLSFDAVNRDSFRKVFEGPGAALRRTKVWESATRAVACVARVLRNELFCDDFRFVPDAASLIPVTQLLIRFPKLAEPSSQHYDSVVAALIFRAFLEGPRDPYKVAEDIRRSNEPLMEIVGTVCKKFCDRQPDSPSDMKWLEEQLKQANSIQNRYVLLLYWLIRRNEAKDFSYKNLSDERRKGLPLGKEREVKKSEEPEKQHIIPLSKIAPNLENSHNRARQGPAHDIGNLTYISSALNSFKTGLGDQLIDPSHDSDDDDNNLRAHMLRADGENDPFDAYKKVKKLFEPNEPDRKAVESHFLDFCNKRRAVIAQAFLKWLKELDDRRNGKSAHLEDVRPDVPQLVEHKYLDLCETIRKRVREGGVTDKDTLENVLIRLVEGIERSNWRRRPLKVNPDRFAVFVRREEAGKRSEKSILVLEVDGTGMTIHLVDEDEGLRSVFDDLLKRLSQEAGSNKPARIGIVEASLVSADMDLTHISRIVILARSRHGMPTPDTATDGISSSAQT